jgi:hypothetical protein
MLSAQPVSGRWRAGPSGSLAPGFFLLLCVGGAVGVVVSFGLYGTKMAYVALLPLGLAVLLPALLLKNFRLYWFAIFLLSLNFVVSKNLNDGVAVIEALKIEGLVTNFTFEITASDLVILILLGIWANDQMFHPRPLRFPPIGWMLIGYLAICLFSIIGTEFPYLGFVELTRQLKYFVVYLFALNCLDSKKAVRVLVAMAVAIMVIQAGMTVIRFGTGYMTPLTLADTRQDLAQITQYLTVDRSDPGSWVRAYGTLGSPGATIHLAMMAIPFGLFLCVRHGVFGRRWLFVGLTAFGILGLVLTFTRVYFILIAVQLVLAYFIMIRDRLLTRDEAVALAVLGLVALAAVSPKLYYHFTVREDSVSVRFLQYEASTKMILDYPLFGVGLNNEIVVKKDYNPMTYDPYDSNTQFDREAINNVYLSVMAEIGIVGALLFFGFFARIGWLAWRYSRRSPDPEVRLLAGAVVVALSGVAVTGWFDPLQQETSFLMLLWLYAGIVLNLPLMAEERPPVIGAAAAGRNAGAIGSPLQPG